MTSFPSLTPPPPLLVISKPQHHQQRNITTPVPRPSLSTRLTTRTLAVQFARFTDLLSRGWKRTAQRDSRNYYRNLAPSPSSPNGSPKRAHNGAHYAGEKNLYKLGRTRSGSPSETWDSSDTPVWSSKARLEHSKAAKGTARPTTQTGTKDGRVQRSGEAVFTSRGALHLGLRWISQATTRTRSRWCVLRTRGEHKRHGQDGTTTTQAWRTGFVFIN